MINTDLVALSYGSQTAECSGEMGLATPRRNLGKKKNSPTFMISDLKRFSYIHSEILRKEGLGNDLFPEG